MPGHDRCCGIEVFVLQFSQCAAVYGVSELSPEALDIKAVCASADLFVRRKSHGDAAMLYFRMGDQVFHGGKDLCYARLVVGAQQRGAVGDDQVLAYVVL